VGVEVEGVELGIEAEVETGVEVEVEAWIEVEVGIEAEAVVGRPGFSEGTMWLSA
jgi:hypothetical protein